MQQWWEEEFGPNGTLNGGAYADKSYWIATEDWDTYVTGNPNQNYPVDLDVYNKMGGFSNGYVPLFIVIGDQNKVYYNDNPNDFRAALRLAIDEMPAPGTGSTSVASFSKSTAPDTSVIDSFDLISSGSGDLSYSLGLNYTGFVAAGSTWHSNDFESGLVYTNSGSGNWATYAGGDWNNNTTCANAANTSTSIMTSAAFNTTGIGDRLWLEFRYGTSYQTGARLSAEYWNGTAWVEVWSFEESGVGTAKIELPAKATNTQIRFTGVMVRVTGTHSILRLDDVKVYSDDKAFQWLLFDQVNQWGEPTETGSILTGTSKNFNLTFDAAGLAEGVYNADIVITCTDPVNSPLTIPVELTVAAGGSLGAPANVTTGMAGSDLRISWEAVTGADSYDVYSSGDPYGIFSLQGNTVNTYYDYTPGTTAKMFFYVVAKNSTKESPKSVIIKQ